MIIPSSPSTKNSLHRESGLFELETKRWGTLPKCHDFFTNIPQLVNFFHPLVMNLKIIKYRWVYIVIQERWQHHRGCPGHKGSKQKAVAWQLQGRAQFQKWAVEKHKKGTSGTSQFCLRQSWLRRTEGTSSISSLISPHVIFMLT